MPMDCDSQTTVRSGISIFFMYQQGIKIHHHSIACPLLVIWDCCQKISAALPMFLSVPRHNEVLWVCIGLNFETLETSDTHPKLQSRYLSFGSQKKLSGVVFLWGSKWICQTKPSDFSPQKVYVRLSKSDWSEWVLGSRCFIYLLASCRFLGVSLHHLASIRSCFWWVPSRIQIPNTHKSWPLCMIFFAAWWAPMKCFTTASKLSEKHRLCLLFFGIFTPSVPKKKGLQINRSTPTSPTPQPAVFLWISRENAGGRSLTLCVKRMSVSSSIPGRWSREVLYQLEVGLVGEDVPP